MKTPLLYLLLLGMLVESCKSKPQNDPKPAQIADMDILIHSTGYWEWQSSISPTNQLTPASVGFSRELVFKGDGSSTSTITDNRPCNPYTSSALGH